MLVQLVSQENSSQSVFHGAPGNARGVPAGAKRRPSVRTLSPNPEAAITGSPLRSAWCEKRGILALNAARNPVLQDTAEGE